MKRAVFLLNTIPLALLLNLALAIDPGSAAAQGTVTFGGGASGQAGTSGTSGGASGAAGASGGAEERDLLASGMAAPGADNAEAKEWAERDRKMNEAATLTGGIGLLHLQHAQGGAPGQFRVGFTTEYFSAGFLCTDTFPCKDPRNANSHDPLGQQRSHRRAPHALDAVHEVARDLRSRRARTRTRTPRIVRSSSRCSATASSARRCTATLGNIFHVGGAFELWLVNGTGSVGLDGGGTGAKFRGLATADLRGAAKPIPVRFSTNLTYVLDNSGDVVEDTETARGTPITRIERFGLGINRVDHFDIGLGAEVFAAQEKVRPFIEYNIAIPVNRQNYLCRPNNPSGDLCLANQQVAPSSLTIGGRFFPWKRGFNLLLALDIGVTGVSTFIEEVKPEAPWMLYLGAGWAFDTQDRPPVIKERIVEKAVAVKAPGRKIRGFVHEENKTEGIAGAIITWDNRPELTSLVTFPDGHFTTHELDDGSYVFGVKADGYKPGQCRRSSRAAGRAPRRPPALRRAPVSAEPAAGDRRHGASDPAAARQQRRVRRRAARLRARRAPARRHHRRQGPRRRHAGRRLQRHRQDRRRGEEGELRTPPIRTARSASQDVAPGERTGHRRCRRLSRAHREARREGPRRQQRRHPRSRSARRTPTSPSARARSSSSSRSSSRSTPRRSSPSRTVCSPRSPTS